MILALGPRPRPFLSLFRIQLRLSPRFPANRSNLTPGITRRAFNSATAKPCMKDLLTRGRVHAVVRRGIILQETSSPEISLPFSPALQGFCCSAYRHCCVTLRSFINLTTNLCMAAPASFGVVGATSQASVNNISSSSFLRFATNMYRGTVMMV